MIRIRLNHKICDFIFLILLWDYNQLLLTTIPDKQKVLEPKYRVTATTASIPSQASGLPDSDGVRQTRHNSVGHTISGGVNGKRNSVALMD
jgi:hypothetical protein